MLFVFEKVYNYNSNTIKYERQDSIKTYTINHKVYIQKKSIQIKNPRNSKSYEDSLS